jgi:proteasome accessory factor A
VDRVLPNGARFYHDHGHPEYSTPECRTLRDLTAHDRAGQRIVWAAAQSYQERTGRKVAVYKNNTDYYGMSYGCHENYLMRRDLPFEHLVMGLVPFMVTRALYAGAGKVGAEGESDGETVLYQLSQRADFFDEIVSVDTLHRRPLINTRDEPHADRRLWRRLHLICGDANVSEYATALKVGTTSLVLDVLEAGYAAPVELKDPVQALRKISHDPMQRWLVETTDGKTIPAIEIQRAYCLAAEELFSGRDEDTDWVLREWSSVLDDLESDPRRLKDRLDWVAKRELLESFLQAEGKSWQDHPDLLRSLDLEYHNLDPEHGLYGALQQQRTVRRLIGEEEIEHAMQYPPVDTRAFFRGLCVRCFNVHSASWGRLWVQEQKRTIELDLSQMVADRVNSQELSPDAGLKDVIESMEQFQARR